MKRPIAVVGITCLLTQLLAAFLPQAAMWLLAAFLVLVFSLLLFVRATAWRSALLVVCAVSISLVLRVGYMTLRVQPLRLLAGTNGTITADVIETTKSYQEDIVTAVLEVTAYDGAPFSRPFRIMAEAFPHTAAGETVRFTAQLVALGHESESLAANADGIWLAAQALKQYEWLGSAQTLQADGLRARKAIADTICNYWPGDIAAVACAMSIGEKSMLRTEVRDAFRNAGLSHALVVSGLHLSVVCGFVFSLLRLLLRRKYAAWGAIMTAVLFATVTGFTPSVARASIAMLLFYGAQTLGRKSDSLTSLGWAALVLCSVNPYAAVDVGLLLSFSATLGVLAAGAWVDARKQKRADDAQEAEENAGLLDACGETDTARVADETIRPNSLYTQAAAGSWLQRQTNKLLEALAVPVCTALATLPVVAATGIGVSLVGAVCNVLAVPLIGIIVPCGLILGSWNGTIWLEPIARLAGLFCGICVQLMLVIAQWAYNLPWALVTISGAPAVICILGSVALVWLGVRCGRKLQHSIAAAAVFLLLAGATYALLDKDVVRVSVLGSGTEPAVIIAQQLHTAVLFRGGEGNVRAVQRWLKKNNRIGVNIVVDLRRKGDAQELMQSFNAARLVQAQALVNRTTTAAFCDIILQIGHQKSGNYAAAQLGTVTIATSVGAVDLDAYTQADVYIAGMTQPENIACDIMLLPARLPAWLKNEAPTVKTRALQGELCLLVRGNQSIQWRGREQ